MTNADPYGLPFVKMHGLGNDFVIIDARSRDVAMTPAWAAAIGDRHRGVGYDQLAVLRPSDDADVHIDFWNSDGSRAAACGNATRCIASRLMTETGVTSLLLKSDFGDLPSERLADGRIRVNMGRPVLTWQDIPLAEDVDLNALPIDGSPSAVGMGNPHMVFHVEDAEAVPLEVLGPKMEHHPLYPERTNVEFVDIRDRATLRMRVWERGGMITQACGSGACAAAVAMARKGLTERAVTIHLDGGALDIDWREDGVWMTGPVATAFEGVLDPALAP